jgi:hypothetical protein
MSPRPTEHQSLLVVEDAEKDSKENSKEDPKIGKEAST